MKKKENKHSSRFPWGLIAFLGFLSSLEFCNLSLSHPASDGFFYGLVASIAVFGVSLLVWLLKLDHGWRKKLDEPSSPMPWWYGGL